MAEVIVTPFATLEAPSPDLTSLDTLAESSVAVPPEYFRERVEKSFAELEASSIMLPEFAEESAVSASVISSTGFVLL